ncbi:hypothetical protein L4174_023730 (plasmid) [Photobacterium sp. CCB-ST2H9]|uniref:hypothetical protein n=1 Tax=Photobacterium sp. CCB-ST2H9 TaxID=2912855 RepID=UPI002006BD39|nr:hypothetical protein [Photobacterium sp. CCB-ST2H9]UTM60480.1 hypothetical protein L4174_023730 [Photobacterium sp. CCB-ST2H9]
MPTKNENVQLFTAIENFAAEKIAEFMHEGPQTKSASKQLEALNIMRKAISGTISALESIPEDTPV